LAKKRQTLIQYVSKEESSGSRKALKAKGSCYSPTSDILPPLEEAAEVRQRVSAVIPSYSSWERPSSDHSRITAVILEDFSRKSKKKVKRNVSDTYSHNNPVGVRFARLSLNHSLNTCSQGPDTILDIFGSKDLIRASKLLFNWPIADGRG
jgi:hypothetical protein